MHFNFDLDVHAFFGLGDPFILHSKLWRLVSGSYWKNQLSSPVITHSINCGSASTCSSSSAQMLTRASRCCSVRFLGTILAQIFLIPNSSFGIRWTASRFTFTSSAIMLTVNLQLDRTSSRTRAVLSLVRIFYGRPLCCSSSTMVLPSENILCQRKACALDTASSPKTCWSFPCVVVALSPSLTQKKMAYRCAMFRASIFVTRFANTSWHLRHLLHNESLQSHATVSGDTGRIKVNGCLC